jgi:hypothetical protein
MRVTAPSRSSAPWANFGFLPGAGAPAATSERTAPSQPKEPSATSARTLGSRASSAAIHGAQVSRSAGVGLLSGGAQRTVATIRASSSRWPSPAWWLVGCAAHPVRCRLAKSQSALGSPVKIRPVRLPPLAAGARPTMSSEGSGSPQPGIGRPQ